MSKYSHLTVEEKKQLLAEISHLCNSDIYFDRITKMLNVAKKNGKFDNVVIGHSFLINTNPDSINNDNLNPVE